ncbi:MAG: anhydro-N-acetylmuramic acid kinase [Bacteroidota bacterium]|nr:anhydro-N-acetylmuramic acid kinase [Bacteroidota bacterium]
MKPQNNFYRLLSIMSGTSLDGVDLAICSFKKKGGWTYKIEKTETINYTKYWQKTLSELSAKTDEVIKKIDVEYGNFLADIINKFLQNEEVDFIASHGHTIFHQPENNFTLQIGCGQTIANNTKIITINDFRSLDVSLNGQGAPLVPIGDLHLFSDYKYCVNLGGFANISMKNNNHISAFDICPVNIVMNDLCKKIGKEFDEKGKIAKNGNLIPQLLDKLNDLDFYKQQPPKSLGREWVEAHVQPLMSGAYTAEDMLNTFCEHIAIQIGKFLLNEKVLFTGGGTFNNYLISRVQYYSKSEIIIPSQQIIEYKEALIFAFLGILKVRNDVNCLRSVTGATRDNSGGKIHLPK